MEVFKRLSEIDIKSKVEFDHDYRIVSEFTLNQKRKRKDSKVN